ncbi:MAG: dihydrofolate reductase family protein [Bacteroidota bacterium]
MKKVVVGTFLSLDGVMQAPGDSQEDTEGGFTKGGWQLPLFDEESGRIMDGLIAATDALLLGRKTYEIFAAYWPHAPADDTIGRKFNSIPKYVASTTLKKLDWNNSSLIKGDLARAVARMKQEPGSGFISVTGSGKLAQSLMAQNLVDEYKLWVYPIVLGSGKRLFAEGVPPANLKLVDSTVLQSGAVILTYLPEGK